MNENCINIFIKKKQKIIWTQIQTLNQPDFRGLGIIKTIEFGSRSSWTRHRSRSEPNTCLSLLVTLYMT